MKIPTNVAILPAFLFFVSSCDSQRGKPRDVQLETAAENLEAKAEQVREEVKETAVIKKEQADEIRDMNGDEATAEAIDKDAEVTKEVGELRAEQLEEQADKIREQKE